MTWKSDQTSFRPIDEEDVRSILQWTYEPPYDVYNMSRVTLDDVKIREAIIYFLNPQYNFYAMIDQTEGRLAAFCSFGLDGQVSGGDYSQEALDIGLGVHPELTGRGLGTTIVKTVIEFAVATFKPPRLRVTIADFNKRASRVWQKNGFQARQTFIHPVSLRSFTIFTLNERLPD